MRVLVTGGAGFVGSHVVDRLIDGGHTVAVVDTLVTGKAENINAAAQHFRIDICDRAALDAALAEFRPDVVSHQAAQASVKISMENPLLDARTNILGSLTVLEACRAAGVRKLIYAGTGGAAIGEPRYLPVDEEHPAEPLSVYGANKHQVEHYCALYRQAWGLDTTILRYANVYGPRQDPFGEAGVIAIFAKRMLEGGEPVINGTGEQERDYVFVEDIARANVLALTRGSGGMYHLGTGVGTTVNQLYDRLAATTGYSKPRKHGPGMPGEVFRIYLKTERAQRDLGWTPKVGLDEGIRRTVQSLLPPDA
ncbi:MAG: NAD-dependent epimerase/dehydratase family protein [Chloroflexota bacterium]